MPYPPNNVLQSALFRDITKEAIGSIFSGSAIRHLKDREFLLAPGQANRTLYLLLNGRLKVLLAAGPLCGRNVGDRRTDCLCAGAGDGRLDLDYFKRYNDTWGMPAVMRPCVRLPPCYVLNYGHRTMWLATATRNFVCYCRTRTSNNPVSLPVA